VALCATKPPTFTLECRVAGGLTPAEYFELRGRVGRRQMIVCLNIREVEGEKMSEAVYRYLDEV